MITWLDTNPIGDGSENSIKAQVFSPTGAKIGTEFLVNTQTLDDQFHPDVTMLTNGSFVITWQDSATVGDGSSTSIKAQIYLNHAPVAADGTGRGREGTPITGTLSATDSDSDALTYVRVSDAAHGSVIVNADGSYTYTPNSGYIGPDSFTFKANDGQLDSNIATISLRQTPPPFENNSTGHPGPHGGAYATPGVSDGFVVAATGDFNGDGTTDVLWRDAAGRIDNWSMQNESWAKSIYLGSHGADWQVAASGDFNGDGTDDVLFRNQNTGQFDVWIMKNGNWSKSVDLGSHGTDWKVLGTGDFNGDGTDDILFQNTGTGATDAWQMQNGNWSKSLGFGSHSLAYSEVKIGDLDGDGTSDVLWRNPTNGVAEQWHIKNGNWAGSIGLGSFSTAFELAALKDFNGDGTADVLWRNPTTNQLEGWVIDYDGQWFSSVSLGAFDPAYSLGGTGDFNHTGTADVFWQNTKTGETSTWLIQAA